jgi:hypothetical protein
MLQIIRDIYLKFIPQEKKMLQQKIIFKKNNLSSRGDNSEKKWCWSYDSYDI